MDAEVEAGHLDSQIAMLSMMAPYLPDEVCSELLWGRDSRSFYFCNLIPVLCLIISFLNISCSIYDVIECSAILSIYQSNLFQIVIGMISLYSAPCPSLKRVVLWPSYN
jgi:hypothetical protein